MTSRTSVKGWWIWGIMFLVLSWTGPHSVLTEYIGRALDVPAASSPHDGPPFSDMRRDLLNGISQGAALILLLILAALTWKRDRELSFAALWVAGLLCVPEIVDAAIIYWHSSDLLDVHKAVSGWNNWDEYQRDPIRRWGHWGTFLSFFALVYFLRKRIRSEERDQSGGAIAVESQSGECKQVVKPSIWHMLFSSPFFPKSRD